MALRLAIASPAISLDGYSSRPVFDHRTQGKKLPAQKLRGDSSLGLRFFYLSKSERADVILRIVGPNNKRRRLSLFGVGAGHAGRSKLGHP